MIVLFCHVAQKTHNTFCSRFDIHCVNGCMLEQGHYASGIAVEGRGQGEIEHAIFNGKGRITITFDHGKKHYSQDEIDAAYAMLNGDDENEDEE